MMPHKFTIDDLRDCLFVACVILVPLALFIWAEIS